MFLESTVKVRVASSLEVGGCNSCGAGKPGSDEVVVEIGTRGISLRLCEGCLDDLYGLLMDIGMGWD